MPKDYPVERYPYMVVKPGQLPWERQYFTSHMAAKSKLREEITAIADQFRPLDREIVENCDRIASAIGRLSSAGGSLDMELDPYTETRYRVELVRRRSA